MRKGLAGLILGLSLVVASVSWAGFVMTRTILDPGRSERLADQLLDNETLRTALVGRLSDALGAALPADVPVPRQQLEQAADNALEDERVDALIRDGIVRVHQNALEGNDEPIAIDATALGAASRDSLIEVRPELASVLPEAPTVEIELPTSGLTWLGSARRQVARYTNVLALVATAGALLALLVTKDRPAILRRVAFWAFGAAIFWLIVGFGIPFLADTLAPSSNAIVAAIIDVFFGAMVPPAVMMAVFGALLLGASMLWSTMAARRPAAVMQPRRPQEQPAPVTFGGDSAVETRRRPGSQTSNIRPATAPGTPSPSPQPAPEPSRLDPTLAPGTIDPVVAPPTAAPPTISQSAVPAYDTTDQLDRQAPGDAWDVTTPAPDQAARPTWVEGVGYVEEDPAGEADEI